VQGFSIPRPGITHDNRFFWEGLTREKLLIQRCAACHRLQERRFARMDLSADHGDEQPAHEGGE